jgi:hypothetical protein
MKCAMLVIFDAQTLMLNIGRLTYRVPCGKVGNNFASRFTLLRKAGFTARPVSRPNLDLDG